MFTQIVVYWVAGKKAKAKKAKAKAEANKKNKKRKEEDCSHRLVA